MKQPATECPRFSRCAVNNCPLDFNYPNYDISPLDFETKCTASKPVRMRIAANSTLQYRGMTRAEYAQTSEKSRKSRVFQNAGLESGEIYVA